MAKTKISEWSTTPSSNTDIDGINIAEGCAPSGINDAIRDLMAQVRSWQSGASGDPFNGPMNGTIGATTAYAGAFTTLSASSTVTLNGGTANGVTYLNGSKVLTSGSALTFDGVNLGNGGTTSFGSTYSIIQSGGASTSGYFLTKDSTGAIGQFFAENGLVGIGSRTNSSVIFTQNGSEQMRLTSTGLGIGTSSPVTKLDVYGPQQDSANSGNIRSIDTGTLAANKGGGVLFGGYYTGTTPTSWAAISGLKNNATDGDYGGYLSFRTRANGSGLGETMRLDSAGNLGLGVTPSAWGSTYKAMQIAPRMALSGNSGNDALVTNNAYNGGAGWTYLASTYATAYVQSTTGQHQFYTAPSGTAGNAISFTQAMTLGSSGDLLLGTTTNRLSEKLHVLGYGITVSSAENTNLGMFGNFGSANLIIGAFNNLPVEFRQNNTERMRIDTSGNLLVGTTSSSAGNTFGTGVLARSTSKPLAAVCDASSGSASVGIGRTNSTGNYVEFYYGTALTSSTGTISTNGTTTAYNTTSDQRLKENIADADSASSLIDSLQVRKFDWKADGSHQRYGFVAQELVTVAPEAVHQPEDEEQMMAVDYSKLVPMLVKEIQSLRQRLSAANL